MVEVFEVVNKVLGDQSFLAAFPQQDPSDAEEIIRIKTHLNHVIEMLEAADVTHLSSTQLSNRKACISMLREYVYV